MYITDSPEVARIAEAAGVDRIFVDMEHIGKAQRQGGMDTVQSYHTVEDVKRLRQAVKGSELLVRINPIHDRTKEYCSSEEEIEQVIAEGADILMLPYFKGTEEVMRFVNAVGNRAKRILLLETPEAAECLEDILRIEGIDEIHIGINDMSIGYGKRFMFELLADGTVETLCKKIGEKGIPYGFGGIAALGKGALPAQRVIMEHYRIGSRRAILSRSFCNANKIKDIKEIEEVFSQGLKEIRDYEEYCASNPQCWEENRRKAAEIIKEVAASM